MLMTMNNTLIIQKNIVFNEFAQKEKGGRLQ